VGVLLTVPPFPYEKSQIGAITGLPVLIPDGTEQPERAPPHAVETFVIATRCKRLTRHGAQVRRDDGIGAIMFTQGGDQFDSTLTGRAGDQDSSHIHHLTAPLTPPARRRRHATQLWPFALSPISLWSVFIR